MQTQSYTYELVSKRRDANHVTKVWRRIITKPLTEKTYIPGPDLERKQRELDALDEHIEAMIFNPIYRPPWSIGLTDQELCAVATHEGVNTHKYGWWNGLDSVVIKEARQQGFKRPGLARITELKHRQAKLRKELAWLETAPVTTE
jgi:hypothetical protein